ncbi:MAG: hypothetical protein OXI96_07000 [Acidimicrobiaceae bacterium]|nr:hypothetical protein [Acidimicrobiaceae bacterium]
MQQPRISQVEEKRSGPALGDVRMPKRKLAHNQGVAQNIDIALHSGNRHADRPGYRSTVPPLTVAVRQHRPKSRIVAAG